MALVEYKAEGGIGYITLNRPEKLNAFSDDVGVAFCEALFQLYDDSTAQVGIISGNGRAFCSGADVRQRQLRAKAELEKLSSPAGRGGNFRDPFFKPPVAKPIIAAVHGYCYGMGVRLALYSDMLVATRDAGIRRFIYAASSSTYGDSRRLPKLENEIGDALSPYAVSKHADELYARVFGRCYGMETIGLRYFNVFGPRQDPQGAYAAVIPRWIGEILKKKRNVIYGDGRNSRDFCYVDNVVQANLLAGTALKQQSLNEVYNVACGEATTLRQLHAGIRGAFQKSSPGRSVSLPIYRPFRAGDVWHSLASIGKARRLLGYRPTDLIREGILKTVESYVK